MKKVFILILLTCVLPLSAKVLDPSAPYGSRKNPVPVGQWMQFRTAEQEVSILINGVIAGDKAAEFLAPMNQFTIQPTESQEYFLIGIQAAHLKDLTGNDEPFTITRYNWRLADEKYTILNKFDIILLGSAELKATMYEGGDAFGVIAYIVDKGAEYYAIYDKYWFDLTSSSTVR